MKRKPLDESTEIQKPDTAEPIEGEENLIEVGQWYWVSDEDGRWFGCVTHLGSNYVQVTKHTGHNHQRFLYEDFDKYCTLEPDPDKVINSNVQKYQKKVHHLMEEVRVLTARLAVSPSPELTHGGHTNALARLDPQLNFEQYKKDLVKAKEKQLPELFEKIKNTHEILANWMKARVVPLEAARHALKGTLQVINDRIFSVELYAGLIEQVVQVKDGAAATLEDKVHLMQRLCYMDEECLARYEAGGMDYQHLEDFDAWLARSENLERLLPHPRCIVAFRVRRYDKKRDPGGVLWRFIQIFEEAKEDRRTYLYIRNGEQLWRLSTGVDFEAKLFPDLEQAQYSGKLWAKKFGGQIQDEIISDREYQGILAEHQAEVAQWEACNSKGLTGFRPRMFYEYEPFNKSSVYYDDIKQQIDAVLQAHNRIALILQGLLDRSLVLHPHPPWQIGTPEGFQQALVLVYDSSRSLTQGDPPDFEAYRKHLNQSLKVGSVTVGQQLVWLRAMAEKENDRRDRNWRYSASSEFDLAIYKPYGNPGPGRLARVAEYSPRVQRCTFRWFRESRDWSNDNKIPTSFKVYAKDLLNVDAYTPGDFRKFFEDPRTRENYLQWAPLLLTAEDYHAGCLKVSSEEDN